MINVVGGIQTSGVVSDCSTIGHQLTIIGKKNCQEENEPEAFLALDQNELKRATINCNFHRKKNFFSAKKVKSNQNSNVKKFLHKFFCTC